MKKLIVLFGVVAALCLAAVVPALAQTGTTLSDSCKISSTNLSRVNALLGTTGCQPTCPYSTDQCGLCCVLSTVYTVTDWAFFILMAIAVFYIILAGIKFVTSGDNPDEVSKARSMILFAAVGIAVALLARAVPALVKFVLGG